MNESQRVAIITFIITVILIIICAVLLPDTVQVMNSMRAMTAIYLPKFWAIFLPSLFSLVGIMGVLISKKDRAPEKYKALIISIIAIIFLGYMILANCNVMS